MNLKSKKKKTKKIRERRTDLIVRDWLAIDRTNLANERTFLAYFRTSIMFLASGLSILKITSLHEIREIGVALIFISPFIFLSGYLRWIKVRRKIKKYYTIIREIEEETGEPVI